MLLAVIRGSQGNPRLSIVKLKRAILAFYTQYRLFPTGVVSELDSVQDWADKCSKALKRLVPSNKIQIFFCNVGRNPLGCFFGHHESNPRQSGNSCISTYLIYCHLFGLMPPKKGIPSSQTLEAFQNSQITSTW